MSKSTPKVRPLMQKIRETNEIPLELLDRNKKFRKNFRDVLCEFSKKDKAALVGMSLQDKWFDWLAQSVW